MRKPPFASVFLVTLAACLAPAPAPAQDSSSSSGSAAPRPTADRLFLSFIEDAAIANRQWWEGQFEFSDGDVIEARILRGVVAIQPWKDIEVGGRVGFGDTDTDDPLPDGSGGTDFDLWAKYRIDHDDAGAAYTVGGVLTVPTGDDTAGLGYDGFGVSLFGAARYPLKRLTVGGHFGVRFNEDGQILGGNELDGQTSAALAGMVVLPVTKELNVIGELTYESERYDGLDDDTRVLGGVNWSVFRRGIVRAALALGLSDGAPDSQFLVGYAAEF